MPSLLFKLRNVPDDEADEIRELLEQNNIDFYETTAGNWGISMPGIWVQEDQELGRGKQLLSEYQEQRATTARANYAEDKRMGRTPSLFEAFAKRPLASIGTVVFCLFVLYVMISPFIRLAQS